MRVIAVGLLTLAACAHSPEPLIAPGAESLAQIVDAYARRGELSGAVLVMHDDDVLLRVAYGANNNVDTLYPVAQITKLLTAALMMRIVEHGIIELDVSARVYLAEFEPERGASLTVRDLLKKADYAPLVRLIEAAMQDSYAHVLKEFILGPAKMNDTVVDARLDDYRGEANVISTVDDLGRFARAFATKKIISAETRAVMLTPAKDGAAFGCWVRDGLIERRGAFDMSVTSLEIVGDRDIVIVLDNAGDTAVDALTDELVAAIAAD